MISDVFTLESTGSSIERTLDRLEHIAAIYEFGQKDLLRIRLIAEEIISAISPALSVFVGQLWVTVTEEHFEVTVACSSSTAGISADERKKLLAMGGGTKGGVMGFLSDMVDALFTVESTLPHSGMYGYMGMHGMEGNYVDLPYDMSYWSIPKNIATVNKDRDGLETSIIEGFADDIRVRNRSGMLEISAVKKLPNTPSALGIYKIN